MALRKIEAESAKAKIFIDTPDELKPFGRLYELISDRFRRNPKFLDGHKYSKEEIRYWVDWRIQDNLLYKMAI